MTYRGPDPWESLMPAVQRRAQASIDRGAAHFAKECLFVPASWGWCAPRVIPDGDVWLYNHDQYGSIYVIPEGDILYLTADAVITVRAVGSLCAEPTNIPTEPFAICRSALICCSYEPGSNIPIDPLQNARHLHLLASHALAYK